jgi:TATA-binding protein-associated factor
VPYLKSSKWDTRIAAAKAIGGIVENAPKFEPNEEDVFTKKQEDGASTKEELSIDTHTKILPQSEDQLQLETLDVYAILLNGKKLLGSAGKEYDYFLNSMEPMQRLAHQKKSLIQRLGLGVGGEYVEADFIDENDVRNGKTPMSPGGPALSKLPNASVNPMKRMSSPTEVATSPQEQTDDQGLSKRQLNMLKRKNKKELKSNGSKARVVDLSERKLTTMPMRAQPEPAAIKMEDDAVDNGNDPADYFNLERKGGDDDSKLVSEFKGPILPIKSELEADAEEADNEWPFDRLCELLMVDMFDHNWEVRHGAAMGLREVLRVHGAGAGRERGKTSWHNDQLNERWINDLACRLCCVFMLDRFGDYISDNVVAPIRETAGQTMGALLQWMSPVSVRSTYSILYRLVMQDDTKQSAKVWQACHGGMIGMRYLVAVRGDFLLQDTQLMDGVIQAVMRGLEDWDDDVRAVSAATLIPVSREFIEMRPASLSRLMRIVWDCLSNLSDDLSASTGSVMDLLAKLCSFPEVLVAMKENAARDEEHSFARLVPRLFPFLRHTITGVRSAVLRALLTFMFLDGDGTKDWIDGKCLRLIFQNLLVERNEGVQKLSLEVWNAIIKVLPQETLAAELAAHVAPLTTLTLSPIGTPRNHMPMDPSLFIRPSGQVFFLPDYRPAKSPQSGEPPAKRRRKSNKAEREPSPQPVSAHNIDGPMITGDVDLVGIEVMIKSRVVAAKALGRIIGSWPGASRFAVFSQLLLPQLQSPYSTTRTTISIVAEECAKSCSTVDELGNALIAGLKPLVEEEPSAYYADLRSYIRNAHELCKYLLSVFEKQGRMDPSKLPHLGGTMQIIGDDFSKYSFALAHALPIVDADFDRLKASLNPAQRIGAAQVLDEARADAKRAVDEAVSRKEQRDVRVRAAAAAAMVAFKNIPKKASPTIKALMDSIKLEENIELQQRSAAGVVALIQYMVKAGKKVVVDKVVGNLSNFYCSDVAETPEFHFNAYMEVGILSMRKDEDVPDREDPAKFARDAKAARIQRRGAREALEQLSLAFGDHLLDEVPVLRTIIGTPLHTVFAGELPAGITEPDSTLGQNAIDSLSTLRALVPKLHKSLHAFVLELLPFIVSALRSRLAVFRYAAAKCLATVCSVMTVDAFTAFVKEVLPTVTSMRDVYARQGAIETIYHLIHVMEDSILPYVIFLIVPVLGRMSDSDNDIRLIATTAFATLVKLVPLEAGIPDPPGLSEELLQGRDRERKFMAQMLDFKKVESFEIPVAIKATLRSYQQEGVNWLAFLNRYHLHGILCDDMGLGKTLQTLCIVASDHHMRQEEYRRTQDPEMRDLPSLIVCPPTLSGHWLQEIKTYAPFLKAVAYVGAPADRERVKAQLNTADIIITSYEICRNDVDILLPINWNYCVLDEGHLIKNPAAKTTIAVKRLASNHRLILSGTPIQNNVLELWSLFDFLMPGFLGTEKVFKDRFAKPIAASRFSKSSSKEQEAGALAIEALHKQVLPFLLRRLKEEVLDDLPPKIIQNYYCELSDLQKKLFDDFTKKEGKALTDMATSGEKEAKQHIFTALNYMRKLCNSPSLVMNEKHKQWPAIHTILNKQKSHIRDPIHAPKLGALRDLLRDCGIGTEAKSSSANGSSGDELPGASDAVSQHRVLIFCQMKEMLDIVQEDVIRKMGGVSFLRMDGTVEANRRQDIVNKFNGDPSIDVLLMTTSVGGLGLNLTGADTVIFVEHDWNPQKDIQAMDRAHRIGQKKVVNVYRLITRGTLEEKILNLQRFKIDVASTVVNQQKAGLGTLDTSEILDLFSLGETADAPSGNGVEEGAGAVDEVTGEVREKGKKGFLDDLGELWDESQYDNEYNLDDFLSKMKA